MRIATTALFVTGLMATAVTIPATANAETMPTGSFSTCSKLHSSYPAGIAKNKRSAAKIVKQGYERPIICKRVYVQVKKRLDPNRNGVACEVR